MQYFHALPINYILIHSCQIKDWFWKSKNEIWSAVLKHKKIINVSVLAVTKWYFLQLLAVLSLLSVRPLYFHIIFFSVSNNVVILYSFLVRCSILYVERGMRKNKKGNPKITYHIDLNATSGFYFSLQIFSPRLPHKKRIKNCF